MLTLTNALTIEGYTVYHDDASEVAGSLAWIDQMLHRSKIAPLVDPSAPPGTEPAPPSIPPPPSTTAAPSRKRFYVLPDKPVLATDDAGKPIFSLIVYRRDEARIDPAKAAEDVGGGILTFTVELSVPKAKLDRIAERLRSMVYGSDFDRADPTTEIELTYVPFLEGKVSVAVAGEAGGESGEFVRTLVGTGKVSGAGPNRKAVMVKLTQDGASLMSQIDKLGTLPINVQYDLSYEHRLLGVNLRVYCDVTSSYHLIQEVSDESYTEDGYWDDDTVKQNKITSVTETMVRSKTAGVVVTPYSSEVDEDTLKALEKFGMDMLSREMEKIVDAKPPPELDRTYLEKYFSDINNQLNFSLDRRMVLQRPHTPSANIASVFKQGRIEDLVAYVDLRTGFFTFLKVPIRVNADFSRLPVDSVTVTVTYQRERFGGRPGDAREERVDSFNFTDGTSIQTFLSYANSLADVAYDWEAKVFYKGSQETFTISKKGVKDNFLVVPVGLLGMLQVDAGLGLVDFDKFPRATLSLRYKSKRLNRVMQQEFVLDKDKQTALWTEVILEDWDNAFEYKADWLRKEDGALLEGEWTKATGSRLRVDAPIPDHFTVSVVSTGNFKEEPDQLVQVAVSLRYSDEANHYTVEKQLTFTDDKQMQQWIVDVRDRDLRKYEFRWSNIYKGGLVRSFPEDDSWYPGEPGFVVVGEKYLLEVNLFPWLLKYPDNAAVVQVDLAYDDPANGIEQRDSFVFSKDQNKPATWRVRGAPGGPKRYRVAIQYFSTTGQVTVVPAMEKESEAFVIPPLSPPA